MGLKPGIKIAISGKSGCGNTTLCRRVSQTLDLRMINYTFRNLAEEKGLTVRDIILLAEKDESWDRLIDSKQVELARSGDCVLGSRLAIWLLDDADLRVYLTASPEVRAGRVAQREIEETIKRGAPFLGSEEEVRRRILLKNLEETPERDKRDRERYLRLYGIDNDDTSRADLVIDTTTRDPNMLLEDIIHALEKKHLLGNLPSS